MTGISNAGQSGQLLWLIPTTTWWSELNSGTMMAAAAAAAVTSNSSSSSSAMVLLATFLVALAVIAAQEYYSTTVDTQLFVTQTSYKVGRPASRLGLCVWLNVYGHRLSLVRVGRAWLSACLLLVSNASAVGTSFTVCIVDNWIMSDSMSASLCRQL
jgi:hypothetical protein